VDPQEAVMNRANRLDLAEAVKRWRAISAVEARQEARYITVIRGRMAPDLDIMDAPSARYHGDALASAWMSNPSHLGRQPRAEFFMEPGGIGGGSRPDVGIASGIDQVLDMDVGDRLALKVAALGISRKIIGKRALDIARMGGMAFDKVGVVAVHRADEIADRVAQNRMDLPGETISLSDKSNRIVLKCGDGSLWDQWFHCGNIHSLFMPVSIPVVNIEKALF
jgi:hypothetical protein